MLAPIDLCYPVLIYCVLFWFSLFGLFADCDLWCLTTVDLDVDGWCGVGGFDLRFCCRFGELGSFSVVLLLTLGVTFVGFVLGCMS